MTQLNSIATAPIADIANYLKYLKEKAGEHCGYKSDVPGDSNYSEVAYDTWRNLYDTVFSEQVSHAICKRFTNFDWYDPDTSYKEDVCAFIDAFIEYADNLTDNNGDPLFEGFGEWVSKQQ